MVVERKPSSAFDIHNYTYVLNESVHVNPPTRILVGHDDMHPHSFSPTPGQSSCVQLSNRTNAKHTPYSFCVHEFSGVLQHINAEHYQL